MSNSSAAPTTSLPPAFQITTEGFDKIILALLSEVAEFHNKIETLCSTQSMPTKGSEELKLLLAEHDHILTRYGDEVDDYLYDMARHYQELLSQQIDKYESITAKSFGSSSAPSHTHGSHTTVPTSTLSNAKDALSLPLSNTSPTESQSSLAAIHQQKRLQAEDRLKKIQASVKEACDTLHGILGSGDYNPEAELANCESKVRRAIERLAQLDDALAEHARYAHIMETKFKFDEELEAKKEAKERVEDGKDDGNKDKNDA
jgi:hypothetical protein